jgi:uncharacterized protein (DUF2252 family)
MAPSDEVADSPLRFPTLSDPDRTPASRRARGQAGRSDAPLASHAWCPDAEGPGRDPIAVIEAQAATRLPELVPIRHGRMSTSPFAFYRGAAAIMAADLARSPTPSLRSQLCGDAHLLNFGLFETPERSLVFGLNDFDETLPGPFEWDVKRLAASIEIAGRDLALPKAKRTRAVLATVAAYRRAMAEFAEMRNVEVWYARLPAEELRRRLEAEADADTVAEVDREVAKALRKHHLRAVGRLVTKTPDGLRFRSDPPLLVPVEEVLHVEQFATIERVLRQMVSQYVASLPADRRVLVSSYRMVHLARKVVGVGSVGTRAWVVLLVGRDHDDPMVLQLKEAQRSVLAPYAGDTRCDSEGQRVAEGQRLMQAASDHLLGWFSVRTFDDTDHDFYVRQLWDGKGSIDVTRLTAKGLAAYGESCGWTLARGHARSGDRIAMAAYLGDGTEFDEAIAEFARSYEKVNRHDHACLVDAVRTGRLEAVDGF